MKCSRAHHMCAPLGTSRYRRRCRTAVSCFETQRGLDDDISPLDEDTVKQLVDLGMSKEEAEAEAAWDPTATDPKSSEFAFDDIYSVDDALPDDMRADLMRPGFGPEAIIAAGFRLEEYAAIRCTLDAVGASHLKLLIADEELLHSNLDTALRMPEIDWQQPRPPDWIQGGAWGTRRVVLFSGLSVAQQGALVEVLEGQGIDNIAVCANALEASTRVVGEILAQAVQAAPPKRRAATTSGDAETVQLVPRWAEDADPDHVAIGGLPNILNELKGRMKTVSDVVANAESVGDVDLTTGLSEEDRARREAFLQDLLPKERVADFVREAAREEQRAAHSTQPEQPEAVDCDSVPLEEDPVAGAVADAVASLSASAAARSGAADSTRQAQRAGAAASADVSEDVPAAAADVPSPERAAPTARFTKEAEVRAEVPAAVRAEVVREDEGPESESEDEGVTIDTSAEPAAGRAGEASPEDAAAGSDVNGDAAPQSSRNAERIRARRRAQRVAAAAAGGSAAEAGLDDLIAAGADDGTAAAEFDDSGFVDTWLHGSSGAGGAAASSAGARAMGPGPQASEAGMAAEAAGGTDVPAEAAKDVTMDAISRALKSGVDKETLKRYIDEVAEQVADKAGSWLKDVPPDDGTPGANSAAAARLGNALRGSEGSVLQYGPQAPPQRGWDMREEVRAENAERAAAGAPLATQISNAAPLGGNVAAAPRQQSTEAPAWQEDARYTPGTPYQARTSMGHLDPMDGDGEDEEGGLEELVSEDAVRALAQGLGMGGADDDDEFPWVEEDLGTEASAAPVDTGSAAEPTQAQARAGVFDMSGGAGDDRAAFDDVPGWKFDGFEGMGAMPVADAGGENRPDAPQQINESEIDEQVGAARPASLQQLKAAAERHGLDLQELLADARRRGVHIKDEA
eukprot:jgi/Ulvmu1/6784/UM030_0122.1